jgi:hypothetical protein
MRRETVNESDKQQVDFLTERYNAFLENKFTLLDEIEALKCRNKAVTHLSFTCQKLTEEMMRMDETRMQILFSSRSVRHQLLTSHE